MANPRWDPAKYGQYGDERAQPFFDLLSRVGAREPRAVYDLGSGPGKLTEVLAERWPAASVTGIDASADMVEAARGRGFRVRFEVADIVEWMPPDATDLVVTNAALHWVPEHREVLRRWAGALRPGAWLAMQVPGNFGSPSHTLMRRLADSPRWRDRLGGVLRHDVVGHPTEYLELFETHGLDTQAWETTYLHVLAGRHPVLDWVRGAGLRPVLETLGDGEAPEFVREYAGMLEQAYPQRPFGVVYPFRRIFCVGRKR